MSTEFYDRMAATALRLIKKYGVSVTLRSFSPGGGGKYDVNTGKAVSNSQTKTKDHPRNALMVDAPANRIGPQYGSNLEHAKLIQDFNKWAYLDANGVEPVPGNHLVVLGKTYQIFNVQAYAPSGKALLYLLILKS